jgi:hypothetical protein
METQIFYTPDNRSEYVDLDIIAPGLSKKLGLIG